jgi:predicted nucleic acid-binding Zn ribbon protein
MERAARLVKKNQPSGEIFTDDDLARAIWPAAVGKAIATHTSRVRLVRDKLIVEVEDVIWQRQLFPLTGQIVERIRNVAGSDIVRDIEFRIAVLRRQPMRATSCREPADEAEGIQDPVLKKIYQLARKKATA